MFDVLIIGETYFPSSVSGFIVGTIAQYTKGTTMSLDTA
jgi:hypothetical protein